ncbi:MAG: Pr6Pr family membrane protein [Hyphomicrobium sp.]
MLQTIYRAAAGAFIAFCVAMQYWLLVRGETFAGMAASSLRFFSFFTILTNILAAAALLLPLIAPRSAAGEYLARPTVRTAITGYIIIVGVIYYLLLSGLSQRQGWPMFFEHMLHYVTPPLFVLDWLAFVDKRDLPWRLDLSAMIFPLAYLGWTLLHGAASGWYPYPFLDVTELGYPRAVLNIVGLVLVFLALEMVLIGIGRALASRDPVA